MKIYLVGGAVRDQLLGFPVTERDWVVVHGTPEQLLQEGYVQVGRDFPVFLHPKTKEEYALARTERKSGKGYYGFDCDYAPTVTLEEDLLRRDLTINAMAMDEHNQVIDPYHGLRDLQDKKLRHVSEAFVEDPVRVLRVARFLARYHALGFQLADETRLLMYQMAREGELDYLVPERVWQELQRSLQEKNPEIFITALRACGALQRIFPELDHLFGIPNAAEYHAEIDTGVHTLMVLKAASQLTADPKLRFAALVHDLGKGLTPMALWPQHRQHFEQGVLLIEGLCERLRIPADYKELAVMVCRYHLRIHQVGELSSEEQLTILEKTDAFRRPERFFELLTVCEADAKGCGRALDYTQKKRWQKIYQECVKISAQQLIAQGYEGKAIQPALHQARVEALSRLVEG